MNTRESTIEKKLVAYAKAKGCLTFKFTSPSVKGVPDRVFIHNGATLFLELKAPGKKPTPLQMAMIQKLRDQGVPCWWTDDVDIGRIMIGTLLTEPAEFNDIFQ